MEQSTDLLFAVFNGSQKITEEMYEEVKKFAAYITHREQIKK